MVKDHAIYQNNKQTSLDKKKVERVEPVQRNNYQSNTYRKDLSGLHFDDEPRVQEKQQVRDKQPCISVFVACLTVRSSNQGHQPRRDNSIPHMGVWQIYRDTEQPQQKETSQNESKLQFSQRQFQQQRYCKSPIQFRRESQSQHLKRSFFLKKRPIYFHINSTSVTGPVKQN